ncbi:MAG: ribosome biogenesis GTP-binding protein YihA/YsxC [Methylomonas sp.]
MNPMYHQAKFINSAPRLQDAPPDQGLEIAFAGRSNAGKSSAINTLVQQTALARVSKTPGRTQLLNFFQIDDKRKLVDLPGYGYAKVPEAIKRDWGKMMETYLSQRQALTGIVLVMDIRHPLTEFDWQMIEWCQHCNLRIHIILTKADKLKFGAAKNTLLQVQKELSHLEIGITLQLFSALKKTGIDDIHRVLDDWFEFRRN